MATAPPPPVRSHAPPAASTAPLPLSPAVLIQTEPPAPASQQPPSCEPAPFARIAPSFCSDGVLMVMTPPPDEQQRWPPPPASSGRKMLPKGEASGVLFKPP